jgi:NADH-quinone oxidoreductase subunit H
MDILAFITSLDWLGGILRFVVMTVILTFVLVVMGFLTYYERKAAARMQQRLGPNRTGPVGLLQWVADAVKLMTKEDFAPAGADRWVFLFAPVLSMFTATAAYAFIPFGQEGTFEIFGTRIGLLIGETPIGLIALLALSSLGVYGLIMAGWGSNNKYALMGGLRAGAQVISYEISMGISLVGVLLLAQSFNLNDLARAQGVGAQVGSGFNWDALASTALSSQPGLWFILLQPIAFVTYLISAVAETNRTPFDMPEAEGELVSGYHIEYGAMRFGAFFLAEYINMITVSAIASYCFLGGWQSPLPFGLLSGGGWEPFWFVLKIAFFIFVYYWLRWTLPRVRYDQVMGLTWKVLFPVALANIGIVALLKTMMIYVFNNPPPFSFATIDRSWPWLIFVGIELLLAAIAVGGASRLMTSTYVGKSERPVLVANPRPETLLPAPEGSQSIQPARR